MGTLRKTASALGALALASGTLALVTAAPASATHELCGAEVTADFTLTGDIGPCTGDGLVVTANGVDVDLNGYTIFMEDNGFMENVGIRLDGVRNVHVHGGTVTGFDAGVAIEFGSRNSVHDMTVDDNVNDFEEPVDPSRDDLTPEEIASVTCDYGDGIAIFMSPFNMVTDNTVTNNGPYGGISVIGGLSDRNLVRGNSLEGNNIPNFRPMALETEWAPWGTPGMCGATDIGTPGMSRGRAMQAVGIRLEGPGANLNRVDRNEVANSGLVGISIHSTIKIPAAPEVPPQPPNTNNMITRNDVTTTGLETTRIDTFADGIGILASGPIGITTEPGFDNVISGNRSYNNERNGILLATLTHGNQVFDNEVMDNANDGIRVDGRAYDNVLTENVGAGNGVWDAEDADNLTSVPPDNPGEPCENTWEANDFGTVNDPVCID